MSVIVSCIFGPCCCDRIGPALHFTTGRIKSSQVNSWSFTVVAAPLDLSRSLRSELKLGAIDLAPEYSFLLRLKARLCDQGGAVLKLPALRKLFYDLHCLKVIKAKFLAELPNQILVVD